MTTTGVGRKGADVLRQERAERNARMQAHYAALKAQREWKEAHGADALAQKNYREEMAKRTGMNPIPPTLDSSEQA